MNKGVKTDSKPETNILNQYKMSFPSPQNALDIFEAEWTSKLPDEMSNLKAGSKTLFNNSLLAWFIDHIGGVQGRTILELGPLEGGHSYTLEKRGAKSILSIEANTRAFLKCLVIKEILHLRSCSFMCGDFVEFLRRTNEKFDIIIASGVLYHMQDPAELIGLIANASSSVYLWTQYYAEPGPSNSSSEMNVQDSELAEYRGFKHKLYRIEYPESVLTTDSFCGGGKSFRRVMSREDIINCLKYFGLKDITIGWDNPKHQHGPAVALAASRK
ncbi:MAG: hypothetical protein A2W23_00680 [Planctomycetes bacterium RBG_16_43_13]|nr:MAG: hypothetical protein A2W23_00680 [Planctomycetes bacterium RBG_16_43_13]